MLRIAIKMLVGNRAKYLGLLVGISFTSFLVAFALSYLAGFLTEGFALISENPQADIWVMDPAVNATEHTTNIPASALQRVRSSSAVPLALGDTEVQLRQWPVPVFPGDRVRRSDARRINPGFGQRNGAVRHDDGRTKGGTRRWILGKGRDRIDEQDRQRQRENSSAHDDS